MLEIGNQDFIKLVNENNKRMYYYETEQFLELYFLIDGDIVKTVVNKVEIDNIKSFVQQKAFIGSIRLNRRIEENRGDSTVNVVLAEKPPTDIIQKNLSIEQKERDKTNRDYIDTN